MPVIGERSDEPSAALILEWTGNVWMPVCPTDDIAMVDRDGRSQLCCGVCGVLASKAQRQPQS